VFRPAKSAGPPDTVDAAEFLDIDWISSPVCLARSELPAASPSSCIDDPQEAASPEGASTGFIGLDVTTPRDAARVITSGARCHHRIGGVLGRRHLYVEALHYPHAAPTRDESKAGTRSAQLKYPIRSAVAGDGKTVLAGPQR
jgi:hypothetical protein